MCEYARIDGSGTYFHADGHPDIDSDTDVDTRSVDTAAVAECGVSQSADAPRVR
ncbi:hypothetical protein [Microbacterium foliorum]|uniref:hypothetical protein n=1 Tax=Microbacterium foliorum TaxID=104336 RepID=UPI0028D7CB34|nr:hypothetical protein [Microbacterium foliorum]